MNSLAPLAGVGLVTRSLCLIVACLLPRLIYISKTTLWSDESVFGLMAIAIGRGEEFPLYCWGAHYASALISYVAVPLIAFFGVSTFVFKSATLPYAVTLTVLVYVCLRRWFGELYAVLAALFIALPLPTFLEMSVVAHGGYPETFVIGFAIWIVAIDLVSQSKPSLFLLFGFLIGSSFTILWLGVPFIASGIGLLLLRRRLFVIEAAYGVMGAVIGLVPFLYYNMVVAPGATVLRLAARSGQVTAEAGPMDALYNRIFGVPQWLFEFSQGIGNLFAPYGGLISGLLLVTASAIGAWRLRKTHPDWSVIVLVFLATSLLFDFAGNLTRSRQLTPLCIAIVIGLAGIGKRAGTALVALLIVLNVNAIVDHLRVSGPDMRLLEFSRKVRQIEPDAVIGDYDLAYGTAFLAGSIAPVSAIAPPNPGDRRPDWTELAREAVRPAVILPVSLAGQFEEALHQRRITAAKWSRFRSEDFFIYFFQLDAKSGHSIVAAVSELK